MPTGDSFFQFAITEDEVCPCPVMPVNCWQRPNGEWIEAVAITSEYVEADAQAYVIGGYTNWIIRCPQCWLIYASSL